jgi:transcription elongation GreA/GreB family factor
MIDKFYLSRKGFSNLSNTRDELREQLQQATKEMGESVKRDNDLRENPEYMQLQSKISYELPSKISSISNILNSYKLIEDIDAIKNNIFDEVLPGMEVELLSENGDIRIISILGYDEGDPAIGIVSYLTPIAQSLLNKNVGDDVMLISDRKKIRYEIIKISRSPFLSSM